MVSNISQTSPTCHEVCAVVFNLQVSVHFFSRYDAGREVVEVVFKLKQTQSRNDADYCLQFYSRIQASVLYRFYLQ